jgi:hypothetical protein
VQVTAADGDRTARELLPPRFQNAADAAAMQADLVGSDDYLEQYRRETRACGAHLEDEVAAEASRLEDAFPQELVRELVRAGGVSAPP